MLMFGTLFMVTTPIGNREDGSIRMKQILSEVDGIACEDTRVTSELLRELCIPKKILVRMDAYREQAHASRVIDSLKKGENWAYVSDAGTPGISDPGSFLVREAREVGVRVQVIPGPSAVTAFLSGAGFESSRFEFGGFFPRKKKDQMECTQKWTIGKVYLYFESPKRIENTLDVLKETVPDHFMVLAKELTKKYENFFWGRVNELADEMKQQGVEVRSQGEWVFGVEIKKSDSQVSENQSENLELDKVLRCFSHFDIPKKEASRVISEVFGVKKNEVYDLFLRLFSEKNHVKKKF